MARPRATKLAYKDVEPIWHAAFQYNMVKHVCKTKQACTQTIQRLHHYRILDREESYDGKNSMFDDFIVRRIDDTTLTIERRQTEGTTIAPDGTIVDLAAIRESLKGLENYKADQALKEILGVDVERYLQKNTVEPAPETFDPDAPLGLTEE